MTSTTATTRRRGGIRTSLAGLFGATMLFVAALTGGTAAALAGPPPSTGRLSDDRAEALALQWFAQMQAGQIDRTRLTAAYGAQLTDKAVQAMSRQLKEYGANPTGAILLRTRTVDDQTFYLVKVVFPRGDAAGMLFGLRTDGKITGIDMVGMAGD